jgi:hypothetical protein
VHLGLCTGCQSTKYVNSSRYFVTSLRTTYAKNAASSIGKFVVCAEVFTCRIASVSCVVSLKTKIKIKLVIESQWQSRTVVVGSDVKDHWRFYCFAVLDNCLLSLLCTPSKWKPVHLWNSVSGQCLSFPAHLVARRRLQNFRPDRNAI